MDIKEFLKKDRFAEMLGIEILEASNGSAKARLEISRNSKIGSYTLNITDSESVLISSALGMAYFKNNKF